MSKPPTTWRRRLAVIALLAALPVGLAGWWGGRQGWAGSQLQAAREALGRQDLDEAQARLAACLEVWPDSAEALFLAGQTARRRNDPDEAERFFARCRERQGGSDALTLERTLLDVQKGDVAADVERELDRLAAEGGPEAPLVLEALAKGYRTTLRFAEAGACLAALLKLRPDDRAALLARGMILDSLEHDQEALADYERLVQLDPFTVEGRLRLADLLQRQGRLREAVAHYECLLSRQPGHPEALLGLARCRHDLADLEEAQRLLDELLAAHPDHVAGLAERGRVAYRRHEDAAAEGWCRKALALAPNDRDALLVLALSLQAQGKTAEAEEVRARSRDVEARMMRVNTLMLQLQDRPRDVDLRCELGTTLLRLDLTEDGLRLLTAVLRDAPDHGPANNALADHYQRTGQTDLADYYRRRAAAPR
jgi:tetratricopeptide (TPR) repeat protein